MNAKRITLLGVMLSLMLILGLFEKQFILVPGVPGIKPGFSNIVLMFALYKMDFKAAGALLLLKVLLSGLLFAGVSGMAYALLGGVMAFAIMYIMMKTKWFGLPGVSICGAVMHMAGQIICSRFLLGSWAAAAQVPLLLVSAVVTGVVNGVITSLVIRALSNSKLPFLPGKADKEVKTNVKKKLPAYVVLLAITLIAGLVLGGTYFITKDPIDVQNKMAAENARKTVLPQAETFQLVRTGEAEGYGGPIHVEVYLDDQYTITGLKIGDSRFMETNGLGSKALDPAFAEQFIGKQAPVTLADIDAITGATVTSEAVVSAINAACTQDESVDWCYAGFDENNQLVGYVAQTTIQGFGGKVEVIAGMGTDMVITGISVGGSSFQETAGLGAKAKEPAFTDEFKGQKALTDSGDGLKLTKDGGTIDAITAATITSNAVTGGVNDISTHINGILHPESKKKALVMVKPAVTYTASSKGYGGPVEAEVGFDEDGKINYLSIGGENFKETDGIGSKVQLSSFVDQFVGLTPPLSMEDIDAVTGATVSSTASVNAINKAYDKYLEANGQTAAPDEKAPDEAPAADHTQSAPAAGDIISSSGKGYKGPVQVQVSFDQDGKITALSIGGDKFQESEGYGAKALEPAFAEQFIGKQAPLTLADIDAITNATVTSEAVVNAINKAYDKFTPAAETSAAPVETTPAPDAADANAPISSSSKGYKGPVQVQVSFDQDGKITALSIGGDKFQESEGYGAKALDPAFKDQFIGKQAPLTLADIDAITNATVTSEAVINAINKAYDKFLAQ